jgi:hypothetical protein
MIPTYTHVPIEPFPRTNDVWAVKDITGGPTCGTKNNSINLLVGYYKPGVLIG